MRRLYLVRHATPAIQPNIPSREWPLSDAGVTEARALAAIAATWQLGALYTSGESKARSTALVIGDAIGQPVRVVEGFEELRFDTWIGNADEFSEVVRSIFENPELNVRGAERAGAAATRFAAGVALVADGAFPAAIVSHGRVITSYLAHGLGFADPFAIWRSIAMPGYASIDLDDPKPHLLDDFRPLGE